MPAQAATGVDPAFGKIDLAFERNEGQVDRQVKFLARTSGYSLFLTENEAVMNFTGSTSSVIRMKLLGQKRHPEVDGVDALAGTTNYLLGNSSPHVTGITSFKKVRYSEVYPGVDVEYHGNGKLLEYDFIVKPGSNPDRIRIGFSGVRGVSLDSSGDLILKTNRDAIVQRKPRVYQQIEGQERIIDGSYVVRGGRVGFRIGAYDGSRPLIIDPVLVYSTFFGGTGTEIPYGIAVDAQGAVYVTGATTSTDFPLQSPLQTEYKGGSTDAFVFKLDPTGSQIVYSTFIGGSNTDEGHSIAVDASGNAYITGFTLSSDLPIINGFQKTRAGGQEAYALKLNSSGTSILYSTYLGGTADDRGTGIALDPANNLYIVGVTASTNFPTATPYQTSNAGGFADGFVSKISSAGALVYSTYVGGFGNDNPLGIAVGSNGAAYVTGWTTSINFPMVNAYQSKFSGVDTPTGTDDVFIFKLNPAGTALEYSTYVGGIGSDEGTRIAVDSFGNAYVTGYTSSLNFPTVKPYQALLSQLSGLDAFILKLAADGKSLVFSTYFGGFQTESGTGIGVDSTGAVYVAGYTTSFDLPTANQIQSFIGGDRDAFIAKFDPVGNVLMFSSFFGGTGVDSATGLAIDSTGKAYVVGLTLSGDLTTTGPAQATLGGGQDVFVAKLNVEDIVSSSVFLVAPRGASSVVTKGTRTDAVFGYAVADPVTPGTQLTGLAIIDRKQNSATVSEVGIPAPPAIEQGRLFVDVTTTGRSVLSIANPGDEDATVNFFYTDNTGATTQYMTTTVKAHEHFSRFITDDPLNIFAPGTLNFTSSVPIVPMSFFTETNESSELLISNTPIADPLSYTDQVGNKTITIPQLAEGGGWKNDVILVNTTEDRMNGEVRFISQGLGNQPGAPMEVGIGEENGPASAVEFDIPGRSFQKISTSGSFTISELPFALNSGTSLVTPGAGAFQLTGWASADSTNPEERLNGLQLIEYRQLGITRGQVAIAAPSLRQTGRFYAETTDTTRSFIAIVNPNSEDVNIDFVLTDDAGSSADPVTITVPAGQQYSKFLSEQPTNLTTGTKRTVSFSSSLPVFMTAIRYFTNERSDSLQSVIPIVDLTAPIDQPVVIPYFVDGFGWKSLITLVNNTDEEVGGEIRFLSPGSANDPVHPVEVGVGTDSTTSSVFEYHIQPRSYFQLQTNGALENFSTGSVWIVPFQGFHTPTGFATVSQFIVDQAATDAAGETRGNTIFESTVEGQTPAMTLRFYAEGRGDFDGLKARSTRTSIAITNPSDQPATVQFDVTSFDGAQLGTSVPISIPASGQFASYLPQIPGLGGLPADFQGVVRVNVLSGTGVTGTSFRVFMNERSEYLVTTTGPLNENAGMPGRVVFPYVTDSTGYTTQFMLINSSGAQPSTGVLRFYGADGTPLQVDAVKLGSIQIVPFGGFNTPHAHVLMSHRDAGVLTSIVGVEGELPASEYRMYAQDAGDFQSGAVGAARSSVAVANPSDVPATVILEMRNLDGAVLRTSAPIQVPANGEVSVFLTQVPGFETLAAPFEGILRVSSPQGITAVAFRHLYNERGNTLFTTTGPLEENAGTPQQLVFPHIAEGGGYTTQFVVIGGISGQGNAGVLRFFTGEGNPLNLTLTTR